MRLIALVDMDAFFASVEQQCNPALRGKPVAVIGTGRRTVVTTASYEARHRGVRTGMTIKEALALCPELILIQADNSKYTSVAEELHRVYLKYTPSVESYSIDEAFLDITGSAHLFGGPVRLAKQLKEEIRHRFSIRATVGIGHNRLIAKLASDLSKPDGLRWIKEEEVPSLFEKTPVEKLWGIGHHTARILKSLGIHTAAQLGRASAGLLRAYFGITGERLKAMGMGMEPYGMSDCRQIHSISHSITLERDIYLIQDIRKVLLRLSEMVASRARQHGYEGRQISLILRYRSFETFTRQRTLRTFTNDTKRIFREAVEILGALRLKEPLRLVGISLGCLRHSQEIPFLVPELEKTRKLLQTIDSINSRYGHFTITWAAALSKELFHDGTIAPAWRPSGVRRSL